MASHRVYKMISADVLRAMNGLIVGHERSLVLDHPGLIACAHTIERIQKLSPDTSVYLLAAQQTASLNRIRPFLEANNETSVLAAHEFFKINGMRGIIPDADE